MTSSGLPAEFLRRLHAYPGNIFDDIETALATEPSVAVRLNPSKNGGSMPGASDGSVPWCKDALYLSERPAFTLDPAMHAGAYYVQDASSMFISHVLLTLVDGPVAFLDACAAPGGKTLCAADALPEGSFVVANEAVPSRAAVLGENVIKWGFPGAVVTRADARAFSSMPEVFDVIAADVPCSGEGMMRKNPVAVSQWSPGLVEECAALQREIVEELWKALRPGGLFIYSTCTFNREENEMNAEFIASRLGGFPVEVPLDPSWGIVPAIDSPLPCMRFIPGLVRGEGLFMAVFRKPDVGHVSSAPVREKRKSRQPSAQRLPDVAGWIAGAEDFAIDAEDGRITAFPASRLPLLRRLQGLKGVDVIHHGITLATLKGRDVIPNHSLAMSTRRNPAAFPAVELTREQALDYLRCVPLRLDGASRGYVAVKYDGLTLGFVKNLGTRANNMYPRDWRIRNL